MIQRTPAWLWVYPRKAWEWAGLLRILQYISSPHAPQDPFLLSHPLNQTVNPLGQGLGLSLISHSTCHSDLQEALINSVDWLQSLTISPLKTFFYPVSFLFTFFLYSRFLLVIYFIHISVYMSTPISQFIPPPSPPPPAFPCWCPYICSLHLCLYFCLANQFICTIFLDSTYMH